MTPAFFMGKRGQVSIEYLIVIGFAFFITVPLAIMLFSQSELSKNQINMDEARQTARRIVEESERIYYYGAPSMTTLKVYMPEHMITANVAPRAINFQIQTAGGINDVTEISTVNLTGSLSANSGLHIIRLEVVQGAVNLSTVS